jgi:hypothetical protein
VARVAAVVLQTATVTAAEAQADLEQAQVCLLPQARIIPSRLVAEARVVLLAAQTMEHPVAILYLARLLPLVEAVVLEARPAEMLA